MNSWVPLRSLSNQEFISKICLLPWSMSQSNICAQIGASKGSNNLDDIFPLPFRTSMIKNPSLSTLFLQWIVDKQRKHVFTWSQENYPGKKRTPISTLFWALKSETILFYFPRARRVLVWLCFSEMTGMLLNMQEVSYFVPQLLNTTEDFIQLTRFDPDIELNIRVFYVTWRYSNFRGAHLELLSNFLFKLILVFSEGKIRRISSPSWTWSSVIETYNFCQKIYMLNKFSHKTVIEPLTKGLNLTCKSPPYLRGFFRFSLARRWTQLS